MNKQTDKKEKLVFGIATTAKGLPVITLGISQACWEFMKGGSTQYAGSHEGGYSRAVGDVRWGDL